MLKIFNNLKPFFENIYAEFGVREYAREIKVSPPTASSILSAFEKNNLLSIQKMRGFNLYRAKTDNSQFVDLLKFYNVSKIKTSGLIDYLNKYYLKPTIVLFGSFAKGENVPESDIDLCIISEKTSLPDLKNFEKKLHHQIQIFAVRKLSDLKNPHLIQNIVNGTILQGELEWT